VYHTYPSAYRSGKELEKSLPFQKREDNVRSPIYSRLSVAEHFVNRETPIAAFRDAAKAITEASGQLLVFHGAGGQGKTWLCQKLAMTYTSTDLGLCSGLVDLRGARHQHGALMTLWVRNALHKTGGVRFPAFDLAYEFYRKEAQQENFLPEIAPSGRDSLAELITEGGTADALDLARETVKEFGSLALDAIPFAGLILKRLSRTALTMSREWWLRRTNESLAILFQNGELLPYQDIEGLLPAVLAGDLASWRQHHKECRFLVLVDQYDNALEAGGATEPWRPSPLDVAMRALVRDCAATLFVIFAREPLKWPDVDDTWVKDFQGRQHVLGGLASADADKFLQLSGIGNDAIRAAMIRGASDEEPKERTRVVYPIMLELQVELYRQLNANDKPIEAGGFIISSGGFTSKRNELVGRLLRSYDRQVTATLKRLAVARRFNAPVVKFIVTHFNTGFPADDWKIIADLSLTRPLPETDWFNFHDVIREGVEILLDDAERVETHEALFEHFQAVAVPADVRDIGLIHAQAAMQAFYHCSAIDKVKALVWWDEHEAIFRDGGLSRAVEEADLKAIAIADELFGETSEWHTKRLSSYGQTLDLQARYKEAEEVHRRVINIDETAKPAPEVVKDNLNNLAINLQYQGRSQDAEALYRRILELPEAESSHVGVLATFMFDQNQPVEAAMIAKHLKDLEGFVDNLPYQRHLADAKALYQRIFDVREADLTYLVNFAAVLYAQSRYPEAEAVLRRAVQLDPTDRVTDLLASVITAQGRYREAEEMHRRALAMSEDEHGAEHPTTATRLNSLASNLGEQERYLEAESLLRRSLKISEKKQGSEHPTTGAVVNNLASNLDQQGRHQDAEVLHRRSVRIREATFGPLHPSTATGLNNLALNLDHQKRHPEARILHERALRIREASLGLTHAEVATSLHNISWNLCAQGQYQTAEALYRRALKIRRDRLGPTHRLTCLTQLYFAENLVRLGSGEEACALAHEALKNLSISALGEQRLASLKELAPEEREQLTASLLEENSLLKQAASFVAEHCLPGSSSPEDAPRS
jgi:tetratricopeptide (TPR) repeat protein